MAPFELDRGDVLVYTRSDGERVSVELLDTQCYHTSLAAGFNNNR